MELFARGNISVKCVFSGFCSDVDEIGALLEYDAVQSGKSLPTFRDILSVPYSRVKKSNFLTLKNGAHSLSRNVGKDLPLNAA